MIVCFEWGMSAWTYDWFAGKESLSVFTNGCMIDYEPGDMCIHCVGSTNVFEPCSTFGVGRVNGFVVTVIEF